MFRKVCYATEVNQLAFVDCISYYTYWLCYSEGDPAMSYCIICGHEEGTGKEFCVICTARATHDQQIAYRQGRRIAASYLDSD